MKNKLLKIIIQIKVCLQKLFKKVCCSIKHFCVKVCCNNEK